MSTRSILAALSILAVSATGAHAGKALGSGPVNVTGGDTLACIAVNIGTKDLADMTVSVFRTNTDTPESSTTCAAMVPNQLCGVQSSVIASGYRFCVVTLKGSTKSVRGNLCDLSDGECAALQ